MFDVPHVITLSDYLRIAEDATVIHLPLADEFESLLVQIGEQRFLIINSAPAQPREPHSQPESS